MGKKFIDIDRVIKDKNPQLLKWLPKFILNYLKRIIHQEDINQFIEKHSDKYGHDFCKAVVEEWDIKLKVNGLENVPESGGIVVTSNHPLGGMDAMALVYALSERRKDIKFIVNDILLTLENLKGMFVGVNKVRASANTPLQAVYETFESTDAVFIFPAGLVSRKKGKTIQDPEWKKTFVTRSRMNSRPVVPVLLQGRLSNFFYRLANFRVWLGVKLNIEMLYLVHELYKQHGKTIEITFGEPIDSTTFDKSKTDKEWAQDVKERVYALKK